jgi:hypothetical protein
MDRFQIAEASRNAANQETKVRIALAEVRLANVLNTELR